MSGTKKPRLISDLLCGWCGMGVAGRRRRLERRSFRAVLTSGDWQRVCTDRLKSGGTALRAMMCMMVLAVAATTLSPTVVETLGETEVLVEDISELYTESRSVRPRKCDANGESSIACVTAESARLCSLCHRIVGHCMGANRMRNGNLGPMRC